MQHKATQPSTQHTSRNAIGRGYGQNALTTLVSTYWHKQD